jgi:hypothetical protein
MKFNIFNFISILPLVCSHEGSLNDIYNNVIYPEPSPINHLRPYPKFIKDTQKENFENPLIEVLPHPRRKPGLRGDYLVNYDENNNQNKQLSIYYQFGKRKNQVKTIEENKVEKNDNIPRMPLI